MKSAGAGSAKGFLAKVVDRAHGDATVAAPRLPGLFEPVFARRPATDAIRADAFGMDAPDTESRVAPHQLGTHAPMRTYTSRDAADVRVRAAGPARSRGSDSDEVPPPPLRKSFAAISATSPLATGEQITRTPIATPTAIDIRPRATLVAPRNASGPPANDNASRGTHHDADDATAQRALARTAPETPPQHALAQSVLVPKFVPLEAPRSNLRAEADRQPTDSAPAKSEPAIHISIGRIEVRAPSPPAAAAPRAQRTQRPTSLEEYLERKERAR